jgi:protein TonB
MKSKVNIFAQDWCNLVFEGKNKEYGAFELRQKSAKRHATAILLSVSLFAIGVSAPSLLRTIVPENKWKATEANNLTKIDQPKPEDIKPPVDLPQPQLRRTVAFVVPEITNETVTNEAPPVIENLLNTNAAIGTRTQDGLDDPTLPVEFAKPLTEETPEPVRFVPQMPEFMGGEEARIKFLKDNLKYPAVAAEMGISGKVVLQFVVNKDGSISKITVLRGIGGGCDEEAVRVAKLMPFWKPGRQNGNAVPVYFIMPIGFNLQDRSL